jgi:hypothetical protein
VLKKTITYTDFNGNEVSEDFFFHLSQAELVELEYSQDGGLSEGLKKIIATEDGKEIMRVIKDFILKSYGKKSDDGRRFIKNQQLREEFESSEAYSVLFMELITDPDASVTFMNGIVPQGMAEQAAQMSLQDNGSEMGQPRDFAAQPVQTPMSGVRPDAEREADARRVITRRDLVDMTQDEYQEIQNKITSGEVRLVE